MDPQFPPMSIDQINAALPSFLKDANRDGTKATIQQMTPFQRLQARMGSKAPSAAPAQTADMGASEGQQTPFERLKARSKAASVEKTPKTGDSAKVTPQEVQKQAPSMLDSASAGVFRGFQDVADTLAPFMARPFTDTPIGELRDQQKDVTRNALQDFDAQYGDSGMATAGRVAGNVVSTALPINKLLRGVQYGAEALEGVPYLGQAAKFATGQVASNRVLDPVTGSVIKGSTISNKISQAMSSATMGAGGAAAGVAPMVGGQPDIPVEDQLKYATGTGGVLGSLGPTIARGFEDTGNMLERFKNPEAFHENQASNKLIRALVRDGVEPEQAMSLVRNPETRIDDLIDMGPNTRGVARAVMGTPSAGKKTMEDFLENRQEAQGDRIINHVKTSLKVDPNLSVDEVVESLDKTRKANAAPIYKEVFPKKIPPTLLTNLSDDPIIGDALSAVENNKAFQSSLKQAEKEHGFPIEKNTVGYLDQVKKYIDGQSKTYFRNGDDFSGAQYADAAKRLRESVDKYNPRYKDARDAYAGPSQSIDAVKSGREFIKNSTTGGKILTKKEIANLSAEDKELYRLGAAEEISNTLKNTPDGADAVKRIFGNRTKREAMESLWGSKEEFQDFRKVMEKEAEKFKSTAEVARGSRTAPMLAEMEDAGHGIGIGDVMQGGAALMGDKSAAANILMRSGKWIANKLMQPGGLNEQQANAVARLITGEESGTGSKVVTKQGSNRLMEYIDSLASSVGNNGAPVIPVMAAQYTNRLTIPQESRQGF